MYFHGFFTLIHRYILHQVSLQAEIRSGTFRGVVSKQLEDNFTSPLFPLEKVEGRPLTIVYSFKSPRRDSLAIYDLF
jgi:hypothetical protein